MVRAIRQPSPSDPTRSASATLRALVEAQIKAETGLTETDLAVLELQLIKARQQQRRLDDQVRQLEITLDRQRMGPVLESLDAHLQAFGAEAGYDMIWTATGNGNLAFASDAADVTDDLLAWIAQKGTPAAE